MGALMRSRDWSVTTLGPPEEWPQALRTAVRILLNTKHPMYIFWGPAHACLYNDAYSLSIGPERHPCSLGEPGREVWDEIWDIIGPQIDQVMSGGGATWHENALVPITRNGRREDVYWTYSYGPIDDEESDTGIGGVLVVCSETTDAVMANARQAFWLELGERLREICDPREIMMTASEMLGRHLKVGRCGYGEVEDNGAFATIARDWTDGEMPSIEGRLRLDDFGPAIIRDLRSGQTIVLDDPMEDERTRDVIAAFTAAGGMRAGISVPLIKQGRFVAVFFVNQTLPRRWTDNDLLLVRGVAERTWAAVERARAEKAQRDAEAELKALTQTLERQVAERTAELEEKEARLRTIFETSYQYQGVLDLEGRVLDANASSLEGIGAKLRDVAGKRLWNTPWFTGTPGMPENVGQVFFKVVQGETFRKEMRVNLPNGGWRWFDFAMRAVRDESGEVIAVVPEAVETTERHQAEDALRQAQKLEAMGQLTGGVAHDFNNLLTPIVATLDGLRRRQVVAERDQRLIHAALQAADRAKILVQRLLAFARRQPLKPQPVDVVRLVTEMAALVNSTTGPKINVVVEAGDGLDAAIADQNQLEMAILNLAVNARDAMADGGTLRISVSQREVSAEDSAVAMLEPGSYILLEVADTGEGMSAETLAHAIEPFFSTKGVGKGTGLGLSMVHGLASQLGGALTLESEAGKGTTARLWLPASRERPAGRKSVAVEATANGVGLVLLVDDEASVRESTAEMLTELGYIVTEARSGEEAKALVDKGLHPDLLITDHLMPGMTGSELARAVREKMPGTKVLIISGYAENTAHGPDFPWLDKPFRQEELARRLAEIDADG